MMTMMIMMMLMMMMWKDDADGALDPWSCFRDYGISIPWPKTGPWNIRSMAQDGTMEYPFHGPRRWNIHSICSAITWNITSSAPKFIQGLLSAPKTSKLSI